MSDALQAYLDARRSTRFRWGEHDCACFAAGAVDARLGTDYVGKVRAYGILSERMYRKMLRTGRRLQDLVSEVVGAPVQTLTDARVHRGDIVLVGRGARSAIAVATPPVLLVAHEVGFMPVPMAAGTWVWRVER